MSFMSKLFNYANEYSIIIVNTNIPINFIFLIYLKLNNFKYLVSSHHTLFNSINFSNIYCMN
jgi:hypothetical protein